MRNYVNYSGFIDILRNFRRGDEVSYFNHTANKVDTLNNNRLDTNPLRYPPYLMVQTKSTPRK